MSTMEKKRRKRNENRPEQVMEGTRHKRKEKEKRRKMTPRKRKPARRGEGWPI